MRIFRRRAKTFSLRFFLTASALVGIVEDKENERDSRHDRILSHILSCNTNAAIAISNTGRASQI